MRYSHSLGIFFFFFLMQTCAIAVFGNMVDKKKNKKSDSITLLKTVVPIIVLQRLCEPKEISDENPSDILKSNIIKTKSLGSLDDCSTVSIETRTPKTPRNYSDK